MGTFGKWKHTLYTKLRRTLYLEDIDIKLAKTYSLEIDDYIQRHLFSNPRYQKPDKLNRFEFQAFSQFGEDGIIQEIFKRIGTTNKYFVEFGVEDGTETNTTYLLYNGWQGVWLDGSTEHTNSIRSSCAKAIADKRLTVLTNFITAENIQSLFQQASTPAEFDLLSIDIDRNDYYVWKAIDAYKPRVVIIEYNSIYRPGCHFVVDYDPAAMWDGSSNTSASLEALYQLGLEKGYTLVASSFSGVNAFFVRQDLVGNHFTGPFTAENHYEPPRYFLYHKPGHPRSISL
ncbi:MAG: hypothetical protein JO301_12685 [Chitinophagaceae bacterium]|nr:hypothetical protein [Chitinophagaceae bacterium]